MPTWLRVGDAVGVVGCAAVSAWLVIEGHWGWAIPFAALAFSLSITPEESAKEAR